MRMLDDTARDLGRRYVIFGIGAIVVGVLVAIFMRVGYVAEAPEIAVSVSPFMALALWEIAWGVALVKTTRHRKLCAFLPYPPLGVFNGLIGLVFSRTNAQAQWLRDATDLPKSWTGSVDGSDFFNNAATSFDLIYKLEERAARSRGQPGRS